MLCNQCQEVEEEEDKGNEAAEVLALMCQVSCAACHIDVQDECMYMSMIAKHCSGKRGFV